jgi:hypothetical protein
MTSALKSASQQLSLRVKQGYETEPMNFAGVIRYDARFPDSGVITSMAYGEIRVPLKTQLSAQKFAAFQAKGLAEINFVGSKSFEQPIATANKILRFWMEPNEQRELPKRQAAIAALEKIHHYYGNQFDAKPLPPK